MCPYCQVFNLVSCFANVHIRITLTLLSSNYQILVILAGCLHSDRFVVRELPRSLVAVEDKSDLQKIFLWQ